jgi:ABC-2 type transport system permease protein
VASYVGLAFFFGARVARHAEDVNGPVAAIGVPLLVLGGTFFPSEVLPPYLLRAAHLDPVFHMNEALDAVSAEGAGWTAITDHLAFLVVFALVTLALGIRSYRRMLQRERAL